MTRFSAESSSFFVTPFSRFRSQPSGNTSGQHDTLRLLCHDANWREYCGSPLLKKTTTHLGQLRKSTGEFGRSAQSTPKLTIKKLRPARFARPAQFITVGLYSLMVLLI